MEKVSVLLEEGADVNSVSERGLSPLMAAALDGGNPNICKPLATSPGVMIDSQVSIYVMITYSVFRILLPKIFLAIRIQCKM